MLLFLNSDLLVAKGGVSFYNTKMDEVRSYLADNHVDVGRRRQIEAYHMQLWVSRLRAAFISATAGTGRHFQWTGVVISGRPRRRYSHTPVTLAVYP